MLFFVLNNRFCIRPFPGAVFLILLSLSAVGQSCYTIDISRQDYAVNPKAAKQGANKAPSGETLSMNSMYLLKDDKPWYPIMGEMHYSRCLAGEWETSILKMKSCGLDVISSYIIWNHHEEVEGQYDWSGNRDLRAFLNLCKKHHMYVWLRIGPWVHAEARNGGFPDWLLAKHIPLRQNDTGYLRYVQRLFRACAAQCKGLLYKDGGPVIGIQLENELVFKQPEVYQHMLTLKEMAVSAGFDVPYYSAFAQGPDGQDEFLCPLGGYSDSPWGTTTGKMYKSVYFIRPLQNDTMPKLSAEIGAGMQKTYHRRVIVSPADVAAVALTRIASGLNGLGYFMFHGGMNPVGTTTLQESRVSGYPNDLPYINYDFQAPIGAMGIIAPSYGELRLINSFLRDYGAGLCTAPPFFPKTRVTSNFCTDTVQASVRVHRDRGFIFLSNYQRNVRLPSVPHFQLHLVTARGNEVVPAKPVTFPGDSYTIWPYNLDMAGMTLHYATAQPLCVLHEGAGRSYVFFADGASEFVINPGHLRRWKAISNCQGEDGMPGLRITTAREGAALFSLVNDRGDSVTVLVLTREQALHAAKFGEEGKETLLLSDANVIMDDKKVILESVSDKGEAQLSVFPTRQVAPLSDELSVQPEEANTPFSTFSISANRKLSGECVILEDTMALPAAAAQRYADSILAYYAASPRFRRDQPGPLYQYHFHDLPGETVRRVHFSAPTGGAVSDWISDVRYSGDVMAIYRDSRLFYDDFNGDDVCRFKLSYLNAQPGDDVRIQVLPRPEDYNVYVEDRMLNDKNTEWRQARLKAVTLTPIYTFALEVH